VATDLGESDANTGVLRAGLMGHSSGSEDTFPPNKKALLGRLGAHAFSAYNPPLCIIVEREATGGVNTQ